MKNRIKPTKRALPFLLGGLFFLGSLSIGGVQTLEAAATYYEVKESQVITKGVTIETVKRVTDAGLLDIYVMKVKLGDPHVGLYVFGSATEYGLKETTTKILSDHGAVAGVNGDFFGMAGDYSIPLGLEYREGGFSADTSFNGNKSESATFFMTKENNPFITYMNFGVRFLSGGQENLEVRNVNKVTDLAYPSFLTRAYVENTGAIDKRLPNSYKIVADGGVITYISQKGETVEVPPNGFLVIMNERFYNACKDKIALGQTAEMVVKPSMDINNIRMAVSGAGKILSNGLLAADDGVVPSGRQPRTAIGINKDRNELVFMAVDGRTHSIGATQQEMADLMLQYGAYNAMHLDGGGSTTMAAKLPEKDGLEVLNTPSGYAQRKVVNTVGLVNSSTFGDITSIGIFPSKNTVAIGLGTPLKAYAFDDYMNKLEIPMESIAVTSDGGYMEQGNFIGSRGGDITINADYRGLTAAAKIRAVAVSEIKPSPASVVLNPGESKVLGFKGVSNDGYSVELEPAQLKYEVYPQNLGYVENGTFHAENKGEGWIRAYLGDVSAYIAVTGGLEVKPLDSLDGMTPISFSSYPPELVKGSAAYSVLQYAAGASSVELNYSFSQSDQTQAAYIDFGGGMKSDAAGYVISVYGDNSGHWLRGRVTDAGGAQYTLDFAKAIDFTGWKELSAYIPEGAKMPVTLDRVYVAATKQNSPSAHKIYVDNIRVYAPTVAAETPQGTKAKDPAQGFDGAEGYDITFMGGLSYKGNTKPEGYDANRTKAIGAMSSSSAAGVYGGSFDIAPEASVPVYLHNGGYQSYGVNDMLIIKMFGGKGGFAATDATQWGKIKNDIKSAYSHTIVIHTDINPQNFNLRQEYQLFHDLIKEAAAMGKNIYVVSNSDGKTSASIVEGIRYINLGNLYGSGGLNKDFSILRFRINGNDVKYNLEKVFK